MAKNLLIVESPAKAKTIEKILGPDFEVKSCFGHIRDLEKDDMGIDVKNNFKPRYIVPDEKKKVVSDLKQLAKKSKEVWLATDEDREGEAISWHLCEVLGLDPLTTKRIVFHEITKPAIQKAVTNPRTLDMNLVNAQQARRVLDRGVKVVSHLLAVLVLDRHRLLRRIDLGDGTGDLVRQDRADAQHRRDAHHTKQLAHHRRNSSS